MYRRRAMYCRESPSEDAPTYLILSSNSTKSLRPRSGQRGSEGHLRNGFPGAAPRRTCARGSLQTPLRSRAGHLISGRFVMSWRKEDTDAARLCTTRRRGVSGLWDTHCEPVDVNGTRAVYTELEVSIGSLADRAWVVSYGGH